MWLKLDHKSRILLRVKRFEEKREADRKTGRGDEAEIEALKPKTKAKAKSQDPEEWTERQIQCAIASVLDKLGVLWLHVPNEGKRDRIQGARLRAMGLKSGVPDILILEPAPNKPDVRGVAIELKRRKGGRLSENQTKWLESLRRRGFHAVVCKGYHAAIKELEELGFLKKKGV